MRKGIKMTNEYEDNNINMKINNENMPMKMKIIMNDNEYEEQ